MSDREVRSLERAWRAAPGDRDAQRAYLAAVDRAGGFLPPSEDTWPEDLGLDTNNEPNFSLVRSYKRLAGMLDRVLRRSRPGRRVTIRGRPLAVRPLRVVPLPILGERPRRESLYDTEHFDSDAALPEIVHFVNFTGFGQPSG